MQGKLDLSAVVPELLGRELLGDIGDRLLRKAHVARLPRHPVSLVHDGHLFLLKFVLECDGDGHWLATGLAVVGVGTARCDGAASSGGVIRGHRGRLVPVGVAAGDEGGQRGGLTHPVRAEIGGRWPSKSNSSERKFLGKTRK